MKQAGAAPLRYAVDRRLAMIQSLPLSVLPRRMQAVQTPIIPVVAEWIQQHPDTISLGQGVVFYPPPPEAFTQLTRCFADPQNHKYRPVDGLPELRQLLGEKLARENHVPLTDENTLLVTAGGNMAFMNAVLAITDPGDEVILQTPYYFNHEMAIAMAGCRPVLVPTDQNYQLQPARIEAALTPRTRAVVTISPNNPTGAVYPESALRQVNDLCRRAGVFHIHDEAYEYFVYPADRAAASGASAEPNHAAHFSPASIPGSAPHTISLYSLSKAYGFASWRIGYMVAPRALFVSLKKIQDTILICPPVVSQFAAIGALQAGRAYCVERLVMIEQVRRLLSASLEGLADFCSVPRADGAFYFLLRLETSWGALELTERLIRDYRVAVIPGTAFGVDHGCYLRVAYGALQIETAATGLERLVRGLQELVPARPAPAP